MENGTLLVVDVIGECDEAYGSTSERLVLVGFGGIVLLMQCGFAALEAGFHPEKGVSNILFKNMMDSMVGLLGFYIFGYAFAFGGEFRNEDVSAVLGTEGFCLSGLNTCEYPFVLFQYAFAATAVTIISGALGNRSSFITYVTYSFVFLAFIYPLPAHWAWSHAGWLGIGHNGAGYVDFAGAGVVHVAGGATGLVGSAVAGPRYERTINRNFQRSAPHSVPLLAIGLFILYFGFLFFNGGSAITYTLRAGGDGLPAIGLAMINTALSGAVAGVTTVMYRKLRSGLLSVGQTANGIIAGMVAISASAGFIRPWAAIIIGIAAAFSYLCQSEVLRRLRVDDAIDASSAHLAPGIAGLLLSPWLYYHEGIVYQPSSIAFARLGWNVLGIVVLLLWTGSLSFVLFATLKMAKALTVSEFADKYGVDEFEHEEAAYHMSEKAATPGSHSSSPKVVRRSLGPTREAVV